MGSLLREKICSSLGPKQLNLVLKKIQIYLCWETIYVRIKCGHLRNISLFTGHFFHAVHCLQLTLLHSLLVLLACCLIRETWLWPLEVFFQSGDSPVQADFCSIKFHTHITHGSHRRNRNTPWKVRPQFLLYAHQVYYAMALSFCLSVCQSVQTPVSAYLKNL